MNKIGEAKILNQNEKRKIEQSKRMKSVNLQQIK